MNGKWAALVAVVALIFLNLTMDEGCGMPGRAQTTLTLVSPALSEALCGNVTFSVLPDGVLETAEIRTSQDGSFWTAAPMTFSDPYWNHSLDTTGYENGDLYIRVNGTFDTDQYIQDEWGPFNVFNPRTPSIEWIYPAGDEDPLREVYFHLEVSRLDGDLESFNIWYKANGGKWTFIYDQMEEYGENLGLEEGDEYVTSFDWGSLEIPDGEYSFMANLTTGYGMYAAAEIGPIPIDWDHPPSLTFAAPAEGSTLSTEAVVGADYHDLDDNIGPAGVRFFYRRETLVAFTRIEGEMQVNKNTYTIIWDTEGVQNGNYTLRAEALDLSSPPLKGWVEWNVTVRNDLAPTGLVLNALTKENVELKISFLERPMGFPVTVSVMMGPPGGTRDMGEFSFSEFDEVFPERFILLSLPLAGFPEGNFSVSLHILDPEGVSGSISVMGLFHHDPVQAPAVSVLPPDDMVVKGNVSIRGRVQDDDVPLIEMPSFYYSRDNSTWTFIGKGILVEPKVYEVKWDTSLVANWTDYHIKVEYTDSDYLSGVGYLRGIEVRNPPPPEPPVEEEEPAWYEDSSNIVKLAAASLLIGAVAGILIAVSLGKAGRSRRLKEARQKKEQERRLGLSGVKSRREVEAVRKKNEDYTPIPERKDPSIPAGASVGVRVSQPLVHEPRVSPKLTEYEMPHDEGAVPEYSLPDNR